MMIAKCKYSPEFYPLLMEWFNSDLTQDKHEFKTKVQEFFQGDTEAIINDFFEGVDYSTPSISLEVEEVSKNEDVKQDYDSIRDFFGLNVDLYNQTILQTKRNLVKVAIYNFTSGEFVHPNDAIGSTDILNHNIKNYKIDLLNILRSYLNKAVITDDTDLKLNELCAQTLSLFENNSWNFHSSDENEIKAIKAYATLKFFDQIISEHASFIKQQLQIEDQFTNKKYKYVGPHITNFSQVFGANEHADADSSFSDLSEILLNIFPEVDVQNNDIANTSIGKNAFKSFMTKLHG